MTTQERADVLEAVCDAVLHCPQLLTDPRLTIGQRVQAAKQVRAAVARKLSQLVAEQSA